MESLDYVTGKNSDYMNLLILHQHFIHHWWYS